MSEGGVASHWLAVTPRDTVFVRDGRAFDAASDAVADTVRPSPTTIAGAVGAAFGGEENPIAVRGPVLAKQGRDGTWTPYFPVPADLVATTGKDERVYRLTPHDVGDAEFDLEGGLVLLVPPVRESAKPLSGWIPGDVLARYLSGDLPGPDGASKQDFRIAGDPDDKDSENPLVPERRVGLARDEHRRVREGYLYQATHLRPQDGWGFLAQYDVPPQWKRRAMAEGPFGGRGRVADIGAAHACWPRAEPSGRNVLVYLATPAVWRDGWRLPVPKGARLIAAVTGEPEPTATVRRDQATWRASRVLRWAVPAGSVYWLQFDDPAEGQQWARESNGKALDREIGEDPDLVRTAGFGVVLTGAWT